MRLVMAFDVVALASVGYTAAGTAERGGGHEPAAPYRLATAQWSEPYSGPLEFPKGAQRAHADSAATGRYLVVKAHLIFYVADQERSAAFYRQVLDRAPSLHVAGMTEFPVGDGAVLGLMPEGGIRRLLAPALDAASAVGGSLRAELYLVVDDPARYHARALAAGAEELSPLQPRDWGHTAAYSRDPDGYILAFASDP